MGKKVFGIDLGTTYSVIATLDDNGMPLVIDNVDEDSRKLASAVYFQPGESPIVGEVAKEQADQEPDRVVQYVKREIGKPNAIPRNFDGVNYDPITISSLILKRMKEYSESQGYPVEDVVITCPAYFGNEERAATKQAGIIAGMNVLNIINEPTAAALNYICREYNENRKVMVFDLGGGTFDITLFDIRIDESGRAAIEVLDSDGDDALGGIDWDNRLYDYICKLYCDETGGSPDSIDNELLAIIKRLVEKTKMQLSLKPTYTFTLSYGGESNRITVPAEKFEELTQDLVVRTTDFVQRLLAENSLSADDINIVLLVGGSTKMPMIKKTIEDIFPGRVRIEEPDFAVAKGAAIMAAIEWNEITVPKPVKGADTLPAEDKNGVGDVATVQDIWGNGEEDNTIGITIPVPTQIIPPKDILSRSFGPAVFVDETNYMIDNLLFVGDESPSEATGNYVTRGDNQKAVEFTVFENVLKDRENNRLTPNIDAKGNEQYVDPALKVKSLGDVRLELPPGTPKGTPIEVFFRCSAVGLEVRATNGNTHESITVMITSENVKSQEELEEDIRHMATVTTTANL